MKYLLVIPFFLFFNMYLFGQALKFEDISKEILDHLDDMGISTSSLLNSYESEYFNIIFKNARNTFDFKDKKVGFITGSSGKTQSNKKQYFDLERDRFHRKYTPSGGTLYIFNEVQKEESGGYDAVIVYWSKVLIPAKDLPKRLRDDMF
jgi:hypothetical protein